MKKPFWVIQADRDARRDLAELARSLRASSTPFVGCQLSPFSNEIEYLFDEPPADATIIPYGSTKLTALARERHWDGLFYDESTFRVDVWNAMRDDMLNSDAMIKPVHEVERWFNGFDEDEYFFIRPVEDLKAFTGVCVPARELAHWSTSHHAGSAFGSGVQYAKEFTRDTLCAVAPAKHIDAEWRFFVVNGVVISGSLYWRDRMLVRERVQLGSEVFEVADAMVQKWLPHEVCVMDIAKTPNGYRVIEFNTFNSSGFYDHGVAAIARAVTDYVSSQSSVRPPTGSSEAVIGAIPGADAADAELLYYQERKRGE